MCVLGIATYSLYEAVLLAERTGLVEVARRSRGVAAEEVEWPKAWAYLLGLSLFIASALLGLVREFGRWPVGRLALAMFSLGAFLVLFSGLLVHPLSAVALIGIILGAPLALYGTAKFRRSSILLGWLLILLILLALAWRA